MDRRLPLAIGLMISLMVLSNWLFPPSQPTSPPPSLGQDSVVIAKDETRLRSPGADGEKATTELAPADGIDTEREQATGKIVTVTSSHYEYRFDTRGARLVSATMREYANFAPGAADGALVELLREGDALLGYRVAAGQDTVSLNEIVFAPSTNLLEVQEDGDELRFVSQLGDSPLSFEVSYRFFPDDYRIEVTGGLEGLGDRGYSVLIGLGRGMAMNEANEREDVSRLALATREKTGAIGSESLKGLEEGERRAVRGGPFSWAASKSKYWLAALVASETSGGFGGVVMRGINEENAAEMEVTVPVRAGTFGFEYVAYVGPQDFARLQAIGQDFENVNPFGWSWLQWFIRPFGNLMVGILIWLHEAFELAYGGVLILFGVLSRIVLFPLYQISMRQQMKQMAIQPEIKRIQERHKENPQQLQQEMMKVYKEHGVNPVGSCLPMLLPFPILITLFFVFQNTIEFRGVPFLWLPDLSLADPIYVVPLVMGSSMMLLSWIGQRGMETNPQMKMFTYVLPVVFTFMFARFAAGLNMYYAASNIASLPQQIYLSRERRKARSGASSESRMAGESKGHPDTGGVTRVRGSRRKGKRRKGKRRKGFDQRT